ncbi:MAG: hypothetical protein Kow0077_24250 [Anaerolineae bacterium]
MGEHPYYDDDLPDESDPQDRAAFEDPFEPDPLELSEDSEQPSVADELPPGVEDFEMPTRRIYQPDPDELEDMLAQTRVSAAVPDDLPPEAPADEADDYFSQRAALDETVVNPVVAETPPRHDEAAVPAPGAPYGGVADVPPTRSYTDFAAPQPPVYGGFEDRQARPPQKRRKRTARERRDSGLYFPWWSLLLLLAGVALVAGLIFMALTSLGGQFLPGGETPVIIVVTSTNTPAPTRPPVTPTPRLPTATSTPALIGEGTEAGTPGEDETPGPSLITPAPEQFEVRIGAEIEIFDVGAAGLNVREGAGTTFPVRLIAAEGSRFEVIGGPEESGGFTWWQIRSVDDPTIEGWAVADFLRVPRE